MILTATPWGHLARLTYVLSTKANDYFLDVSYVNEVLGVRSYCQLKSYLY